MDRGMIFQKYSSFPFLNVIDNIAYPLIHGKHFSKKKAREKAKYWIEKIIDQLDKACLTLLKDITMLDNMYKTNLQYLRNLDYYIAAGLMKRKELNETMLPELKKKADTSNDPKDVQRLQDFTQSLNRFEKKFIT